MAEITIDLPAFNIDYPPGSVFASDVLSTPDTGSEVELTTNAQPVGIGYFAESVVPGWDEETFVFLPATPAGYTLTRATYVMVAYRAAADTAPSGDYSGYNPAPTSWPFVSLDSSGTSGLYTVDSLPIGDYDGELVWPGDETLAWLTAPTGEQLPANRFWLEPGTSFSPFVHVHVAYYALRLIYTSDEPTDPPCDVPITLDLSTASFANPSGDQFGQYVDGIITGLAGNYAQYWFPFTLDAIRRYEVTVTFDRSSPHDGDGNPLTSDRFVLLWCGQPGTELAGANGVQIGDAFSNTADTTTITIGPGADIDFGNWDDPDQGVAQGFTRLIFQTSQAGAVSQISIMKICADDGPTPPSDGGGDDGPNPGGGSSGPTPPAGPGDAPDGGIGFLNPSNRRGAPTEVEIIVDGHWLSLNGEWGDLTWSHTWPGGSANATWSAYGIPRRLTRRDLSVELRYGGQRRWTGVLDFPGGDGNMNAIGLATLGANYAAIDGSGDATTIPDDAIDAAIARGLRWQRRDSFSTETQDVDISQGPVKLSDLLDAAATDAGKRWAVDPDGYVYTAPDPTVPVAHILYVDGPLTPADDQVATALIGRYRDPGGYATTDPVVAASAQWLGYSEDTIDLTGRGVITEAKAIAKLTKLLNLGRALPAWADPLQLVHGDLLTFGQVPMALEVFSAGQVVRVHGQFDDTQQLGGRTWIDVLIGQSENADQGLTLTPIGAPVVGMFDAITQALNKRKAA